MRNEKRSRCLMALALVLVLSMSLPLVSAATRRPTMAEADELYRREQYREAAAAYRSIVEFAPGNAMAWLNLGSALQSAGRLDQALQVHHQVATIPGLEPTGFYNAACAYARLGNPDRAFEFLRRAQDAGFLGLDVIRADPDLQSLRDDPRFAELRDETFETLTLENQSTLSWTVRLPREFEASRAHPVLVALPPGDESRQAVGFGLRSLWGAQATARGWIVVSPAAPAGGWFGEHGAEALDRLLSTLEERYDVEGGRFHLAGCSNGGASAFHLALTAPARFRSLTVVPGLPRGADAEQLSLLAGLRVAMFVGEKDETWKTGAETTATALENLGVDVSLRVLPGEGHVMRSLSAGALIDTINEFRAPE